MKTSALNRIDDRASTGTWSRIPSLALQPTHLHWVTAHELQNLRDKLTMGRVPLDLAAKLNQLSEGDLSHRFIEQNCRTIIALLQAVQEGTFTKANQTEHDRLLRVLAYVRKDDDAIPDYRPDGFLDDQ